MLRIHQCRSAAAAQSYFTQGLAREDYYTEGLEIAGAWRGRAAERLGLLKYHNGAVERDAFAALTENRHPRTAEKLTLRHKNNRTVGYDFNYHAPKGVSLLHAVHKDRRIADAFRESGRETMEEIERHAEARVRKGGKNENRITGNLVWADFLHLTARPTAAADGPDPHLHMHCFVMNCTHDRVEDVWKAGQFQGLVRDAPYFEAAFHARFARRLEHLGYAVERTAKGWDLKGVPRSLIGKYSTRTAEIEAFAAAKNITDPKQKAELGARTRKAKDKTHSAAELAERWEKRLDDRERGILQDIADGGAPPDIPGDWPDPPPGSDSDGRTPAQHAVDHAIAHCFERRSTIAEVRLVEASLRFGVGRVTPEDAWEEVRSRTLLSRTVKGQTIVTTSEVLAQEKAMVAFAVDGKGACGPAREALQRRTPGWQPSMDSLAEDQKRAIEHVLDSRDRVMVIRGGAGVGKTTTTLEAINGLKAAGLPVTVVAPTAGASRGEDGLRGKGLAGADTVSRLLASATMQAGLRGGVLWVDEAGLLGAGTMHRLFEIAAAQDARVVLCGDVRQHQAVERGDALRTLETQANLAPVELTTIRRQTGIYREAVAAIADGNLEKGFASLDTLRAFHEVEDGNRRGRMAALDYTTALVNGRTAMIVAPTHAEGARIAGAVRELQREQGLVTGDDRGFVRLRDTRWTDAERADPSMYKSTIGDDGRPVSPPLVAHFHQGAKGVVAGDRCEILGVRRRDDGGEVVRARTPRGVEIDLPLDASDRFQVFAKESIELAVGERVRITRNGRIEDGRARVTNGDVYTIKGFTKNGDLRLEHKGREKILPKGYGHIAYGCVSTSHAAQGKDVDLAILVQSAGSILAGSAEQFYVSISRGKLGIRVYTDDTEALKDAVRRSCDRLGAIELVETKQEDPIRLASAPTTPLPEVTAQPARLKSMREAARLHGLARAGRDQSKEKAKRMGPGDDRRDRSTPPGRTPDARRRDGRERGYER